MAKLVHFTHSCPLTSLEIVNDGICNICLKDEPIHFTCKPCNFELCNTCSKLPQKVSHDFHSHQHPLEFCLFQYDRKPRYIICSGCGNMSSCSFYECKKCEIYLDLGCALLKDIITGWDIKEMLHYSHAHLLRRCRPGPDVRGSCLLCELPLSPSSICYGCIYCYSFLHERCLDLPTEIEHPVHPEHPLKRLDYIRGSHALCNACREKFESVPFGCVECNFDIHMRCADSLLRGLKHKSHKHRLFHVVSNPKEFFGRVNHTKFYGRVNPMKYYGKVNHYCAICTIAIGQVSRFSSYFRCVECDLKFHFDCLEITESVFKRSCHIHPLVCTRIQEDKDDSLEYCGVCETVIHVGLHVYSCDQCDFVGHIECIIREEEPSPLYLKDLSSCCRDITRATDREDTETNILGNKIMVNDFSQNHVMRAIDMGELRNEEKCEICKKVILSNPWKCETCRFYAHNFCVELGKPSRHRFHWNHLLTLLPKPLTRDKTSCDSCREEIKGFNLFCRICDFIIHVTCAMRGKRFLGIEGPKVVGILRGCCLQGNHRMVQVMISKSNQIGCDICEERVCGKVVSCMECEKIYHLRCFDKYRSQDSTNDSATEESIDSSSVSFLLK